MVVKNKLAWSSIEAVNRDFGSCLYDLQNFKMLYNKEDMHLYGRDILRKVLKIIWFLS